MAPLSTISSKTQVSFPDGLSFEEDQKTRSIEVVGNPPKDDDNDSGTGSPIESGIGFVELLKKHAEKRREESNFRTLCALKNEESEYGDAETQQTCLNPTEGLNLAESDMVVLAKYTNTDPAAITVSYGYVSDLDLEQIAGQSKFILKIIKNFNSTSKLLLKWEEIQVSVENGEEGASSSSNYLENAIEIQAFGTKLRLRVPEEMSSKSECHGSLSFYETDCSRHVENKLFETEVTLLDVPFTVIKRLTPMTVTKLCQGYRIGEQSKEEFVAFVGSDEQLKILFSLNQLSDLVFQKLCLVMVATEITENDLSSLKFLRCEIESLDVQITSPKELNLGLLLLMKLPLCRHAHFSCFLPGFSVFEHETRKMRNELSKDSKVYEDSFCSDLEKNLVTVLTSSNQIKSFKISNLELQFSSFKNLIEFRKTIDSVLRSGKDLHLSFEDVVVTQLDKKPDESLMIQNQSLSFLILMTIRSLDSIPDSLKATVAECRMFDIDKLSFDCVDGQLKMLHIAATVRGTNSSVLLEVCKIWKMRESVEIFCDKVALIHEDRDFCWLLQWSNLAGMGFAPIVKGLRDLQFGRNDIVTITNFLLNDDTLEAYSIPKLTLDLLTFRIALSDDKNEWVKLILDFLETLKRFNISIRAIEINGECDESGWTFLKFPLIEGRETKLVAKNTSIIFPWNCTEENRLITVEIQTLSSDLIARVCKENGLKTCELSPLVCVHQDTSFPFLKPVSVNFPYPSKRGKLFPKVYSRHPPERFQWEPVEDFDLILLGDQWQLRYQTTTFSDKIAVFGEHREVLTPDAFVEANSRECAFVTIQSIRCRQWNVEFDCIKGTEQDRAIEGIENFQKRKVNAMRPGDELYAEFGGNLTVHEPEPELGDRLRFFFPEDDSNCQEYRMRKVNQTGDRKGYLNYYLRSGGEEKRIFHMWFQIPMETEASMTMENHQNLQTVGQSKSNYMFCHLSNRMFINSCC